jgi:hypothetical protein
VPVALNLYKIREDKSAAGDFFRFAQRQKPNYQGLWLVSPAGKLLAAHQDMTRMSNPHGEWARSAYADLESGLKAFGIVSPRPVQPVQSLPHRGVGTLPDGGARLAVTDRWVFVKDLSADAPRDALGATVLDSISLSAEDLQRLTPPTAKSGAKWTVAEGTARKFFPLLSTGDTVFRDAREVTAVKLSALVEKIDGETAYLSYQGEIAATHEGTKNEAREGQHCSSEAKLLGGVGVYDRKSRQLVALSLVFDGRFRNYAPYDSPAPFGAVVEWSIKPASR